MKTRDYYFDNMKVLLIFLVVLGHMIEPFAYKPLILGIYTLIYSFHMPLFVFVSGFFAKPNYKGIKNLIILYVKFQIIYAVLSGILIVVSPFFREYATNAADPSSILDYVKLLLTPYWVLWYLFSLISWRIGLTLFKNVNKYLFFLIVCILAIVVSLSPIDVKVLSIGRTITFFPFFLIGHYLSKEDIIKVISLFRRKFILAISIIITCGLFYLLYLFSEIDIDAFYYSGEHSKILINLLALRIVKLLINAFMCVFALLVIPHKEYRFTKIGNSTLSIYTRHIFVFLILYSIGFYSVIANLPTLVIFTILFIITLIICYVFSRKDKLWTR